MQTKIIGIGVDIENARKFKNLSYKKNRQFYEKVFSPREIKYCLNKSQPFLHFAGKFAAKEAVLKALGNKTILNIREVEIVNNKKGAPEVLLNGKKLNCFLSVAHCEEYALAFSIVMDK